MSHGHDSNVIIQKIISPAQSYDYRICEIQYSVVLIEPETRSIINTLLWNNNTPQ